MTSGGLLDRYLKWRRRHLIAHLSVLLSFIATVVVAVAFTAQDLPVLPRADVEVIGLAGVLLVAGLALGAAGYARRAGSKPVEVIVVALALALVADVVIVFLFKLAGGIGWPDWLELLLLAIVVAAVVVGAHVVASWVARKWSRVGLLAVPVITIAAVTAYGIAFAQLSSISRPDGDARDGVCEEYAGITYCAFAGEEGTIRYWRSVTERVLSQVPGAVAAEGGLVVQSNDGLAVPSAIAEPSGGWATPGANGVADLALGLDVADWATGVRSEDCVVWGQARAIVAMWLAGQVSAEAATLASHLDAYSDSITGGYAESIHGGNEAGLYAAQLFERPIAEVGQVIRDNWGELVDPASDYRVAERILDLEPVTADSPPGGEDDPGPPPCI